MRQHYIICVLSTLGSQRDLTKHDTYTFDTVSRNSIANHRIQVQGIQTNEAPVKTLIRLADDSDDPITGIVYLASEACRKRTIPMNGGEVSAEEYFRQKITQFYDSIGQTSSINPTTKNDFFIALEYNEKDPSENLKILIDAIDREDALIDIDSTGGPRDAVFLIPPIVQFIEAKYSGFGKRSGGSQRVGLGTVLYSNLGTKKLYRQDSTFELTDLINGLNSFTMYGKADALCDYFERPTTATPTSTEMHRLCNTLRAFSDDLALCQVASIDRRVIDIHESLNAFEEATQNKIQRYGRPKEASKGDASEVAPKVETANAMTRRGELLFLSLVPTFRSDFIHPSGEASRADQLIEVLRWCVRRKMLQQTLSFYNEHAVRILEDSMFCWADGFPPPNDMDAANYLMYLSLQTDAFIDNPDDVKNKAQNLNIPILRNVWAAMEKTLEELGKTSLLSILKSEHQTDQNRQLKRAIGVLFPELLTGDTVLNIKDTKQGEFTANLIWYYYLHGIRNEVMHAKARASHSQRKQYGDAWHALLEEELIEIKCTNADSDLSCDPLKAILCTYGNGDNLLESLTTDLNHVINTLRGHVSVTLRNDVREMLLQRIQASIMENHNAQEELSLEQRIGNAVSRTLDRHLSGCAITWDDVLEEDDTLDRDIKEKHPDLCKEGSLDSGKISEVLNKWTQQQENQGRFVITFAIRWKGIELPPTNQDDLAQRIVESAKAKEGSIVLLDEVFQENEKTKRNKKAFKNLPRLYPEYFESAPHALVKV